MNVKTKVSILLTLLTLSACQPKSSKSTSVGNSKPIPQEAPVAPGEIITNKKVVTAEGVEIILSKNSDEYLWNGQREDFIQNLNRYKVKIKIPLAIVKEVAVLRVDLDKDLQQEVYFDDANIDDKKVELIERYQLDYYAPKNIAYKVMTQDRVLADIRFELLPDFIIIKKQSASDIKLRAGSYRFATIVLDKNTIFETQGLDLNFVASKMYVDNALVTTFGDAAEPAPIGMPGKDGGSLRIDVNRVEGDVTFNMQGQKGGQGYPGLDNSGALKARDGNPGTAGQASGGYGLDRTGHQIGSPAKCTKIPTNGDAGADGVPGGKGYEGSRGGSSGAVILTYNTAENFQSKLLIKGGLGGDGGIGGAGGMPGKGGLAGAAPALKKACPAASDGPDGKLIAGATGPKGESGIEERSCISQKNETTLCN